MATKSFLATTRYVYALYRNYGFDMVTIGYLFCLGYAVSGV